MSDRGCEVLLPPRERTLETSRQPPDVSRVGIPWRHATRIRTGRLPRRDRRSRSGRFAFVVVVTGRRGGFMRYLLIICNDEREILAQSPEHEAAMLGRYGQFAE